MKWLLVPLLLVMACAPTTFFGGRVVGPFHHLFNGQMDCAWVSGWQETRCMCMLTDPHFSRDRTFMAVEPVMCKED